MEAAEERNEFDETRWGFRGETTRFLNRIKTALLPIAHSFEMLLGDTCCGTCAAYEVGAGMDQNGKPYGLYWHIQDEEGLDETGEGLYIGFLAATDEAALEAAAIIRVALDKQGLPTAWDGSLAHRIYVKADLGRRPFPRATQPELDC